MRTAIFVTALAGLACGGETAPEPGVIVRDGRFVVRESGEAFRPVGFNFIRLFNERRSADHDNFSRTGYDASEHEAMLRRMSAAGFNTVRVFIQVSLLENQVDLLSLEVRNY